ncbi:MAG TPA: hypothetical protein VM734_00370 [Kofleriaceae bacterium]|nr:hypothetical protein [Kofleriaceae bacterium]
MTTRSPFLVSPAYDWAFFLLPPLYALVLGILIAGTPVTDGELVVAGQDTTVAALVLGSLVHAHLVAVVFRSHVNPRIFGRYRLRFVVVPLVLWAAITASTWVAITASVVATFWDVWHSGAQTFGFARIYERNAGNAGDAGRRLDYWLNQLLYAGPILAGATLVDHVDAFDGYRDVGATFFTRIPAEVTGHQRYLTWAVLIGGTVFVVAYVLAHLRLHRRGHRVAPLKVFLLATTGLCSIYTWGFNSWGEAFFIMNLFHAVQYLALVWAMEKPTLVARLGGGAAAARIAALVFFGSVAIYGVGAELLDAGVTSLWALTVVVSLMHFWWDGFIWSVRRQQV